MGLHRVAFSGTQGGGGEEGGGTEGTQRRQIQGNARKIHGQRTRQRMRKCPKNAQGMKVVTGEQTLVGTQDLMYGVLYSRTHGVTHCGTHQR